MSISSDRRGTRDTDPLQSQPSRMVFKITVLGDGGVGKTALTVQVRRSFFFSSPAQAKQPRRIDRRLVSMRAGHGLTPLLLPADADIRLLLLRYASRRLSCNLYYGSVSVPVVHLHLGAVLAAQLAHSSLGIRQRLISPDRIPCLLSLALAHCSVLASVRLSPIVHHVVFRRDVRPHD